MLRVFTVKLDFISVSPASNVAFFSFSCLIWALNLYFAQKLLRKTKNCSTLIEAQKDAPNAKSCSKVAKHNRDRPTHRIVIVPAQKVSGMVLPA